jgi:hypothetical protein
MYEGEKGVAAKDEKPVPMEEMLSHPAVTSPGRGNCRCVSENKCNLRHLPVPRRI